jgi:hypothetical protein
MIDWKGVIVHHSATEDGLAMDFEQLRRFHMEPPPAGRGWQDIGYHAVVEFVGHEYKAIDGRPLWLEGAHCPAQGQNRISLGICFVGNWDVQPDMDWGQLLAGAEKIAEWCRRFDISARRITAHRDWKATACPGRFFPMSELIASVERILTHE